MQDDLEIMNHEIEHDPDIGAAIWIRRKPMRFDEARMSQAGLDTVPGSLGVCLADIEDIYCTMLAANTKE